MSLLYVPNIYFRKAALQQQCKRGYRNRLKLNCVSVALRQKSSVQSPGNSNTETLHGNVEKCKNELN